MDRVSSSEVFVNEPSNCEAIEFFIGCLIMIERDMKIISDADASQTQVERAFLPDRT